MLEVGGAMPASLVIDQLGWCGSSLLTMTSLNGRLTCFSGGEENNAVFDIKGVLDSAAALGF